MDENDLSTDLFIPNHRKKQLTSKLNCFKPNAKQLQSIINDYQDCNVSHRIRTAHCDYYK
ncbi:MAG: hypothetical protein MHMPM18_003757 [Marteilia pararefringens]